MFRLVGKAKISTYLKFVMMIINTGFQLFEMIGHTAWKQLAWKVTICVTNCLQINWKAFVSFGALKCTVKRIKDKYWSKKGHIQVKIFLADIRSWRNATLSIQTNVSTTSSLRYFTKDNRPKNEKVKEHHAGLTPLGSLLHCRTNCVSLC